MFQNVGIVRTIGECWLNLVPSQRFERRPRWRFGNEGDLQLRFGSGCHLYKSGYLQGFPTNGDFFILILVF